MTSIFELFRDPYERKARVTPGLLVAFPLMVPLLCVYGTKEPILTSLIGLFGTCGVLYALASVTRGRGKKLEELLVKKWGGMPTTIILRHRDLHLDSISKQRYHSAISAKLGITMPTLAEEISSPASADDIYIGVTRRVRELTRKNKQLLLKENIAYGFHRNMLAMKPVGIISCLSGLFYGLLISGIWQFVPPYFEPINLANTGLASEMTFLISLSTLAAWIFYFDEDAVRRMGFVYAERLFECLPSLTVKAQRGSKVKSPDES